MTVESLLAALVGDLHDGSIVSQLAVIILSLGIAMLVAFIAGSRHPASADGGGVDNGLRRLSIPLLTLAMLLTAQWVLAHYQSVSLIRIAVPVAVATAIVMLVGYVLRRILAPGPLVNALETTLLCLVWLGFALHVSGLAPDMLEFLDRFGLRIGKQHVSLLVIMQGTLWVAGVLLAALWVGRLLEARLMAAQGVNITLRVTLTKLVRALLIVLAVLIVLPAVGIDLTALSVIGGAIGVGIGFGLQKIASNYVSGFIILMDRAVTIGDFVTVEKHSGQLVKMSARYVVVRAADGTEAIIPNETLITSTVVNQSYSDRTVRIPLKLQVSYRSDLDAAIRILKEIAKAHPLALAEPAPSVMINGFGDNGIDLELGVWVSDPEDGKAGLRSDLYHRIWQDFRANSIEIPYPQREVRLVPLDAPPPRPSEASAGVAKAP